MSPETPTTSLTPLTDFCKRLYKKCRDAEGDYEEISREVLALHKVLSVLPSPSPQNTSTRELARILKDCDVVLRQLDAILLKNKHDGKRLSNEEMEILGECRVKLISLKGRLFEFTGEDEEEGELDGILDLVDEIAAKLAKKGKELGKEDDAGRWKVFRRELLLEGVEEGVVGRQKEVLIAYIREIYNNLDKEQKEGKKAKEGESVNYDHWFPSSPSHQHEGKVLSPIEKNLKFPTSMKAHLHTPRTASTETRTNHLPPLNTNHRGQSTRHSSSESEDDASKGIVIRTSDLQHQPLALALRAPPSPSLSFRSQATDTSTSTITRGFAYGSSPITPYTPSHPQHHGEKLAPDNKGNTIPPNAKWTKVTRRLISPEVLEKRGIRFEVGEEWVAILGELRREQIEELAWESNQVRSERERRERGVGERERVRGIGERAPERPPRPTQHLPVPIPIPISSSQSKKSSGGGGQKAYSTDSDSDSSYSGSNSETESGRHYSHSRHPSHSNRRRYRKNPGYQAADIGIPVSGYPHPFGQPVIAPPSPTSTFSREKGWDGIPRSAPPTSSVRFSESPMGSFNEERAKKIVEREKSEKEAGREREREPDRGVYTFASSSRDGGREREKETRRHTHTHTRDREREYHENYGYSHDIHDRDERSKSAHSSSKQRDGREKEKRKDSRGSEKVREREGARGGGKGRTGSSSSSRWKENLTAAGIGGAAVSLLNVLSEAAEGL